MSLRYILRLIEAFFKRFKTIIFIGIFFGAILFLVITLLVPNLESNHQRIGIVGRYTTDNLPSDIASKLSSGLTSVDINGNVNPALSKSWESPDGGKTWIFSISDKHVWQDKKKVTARDFYYKFSDATMEVIDDKTLKFSLNSAFSAFPVIVSKPVFKTGLVGTGEWEVKNISLAGGYLQKLIIKNKKSDKITYKFYPSEETLRLAFKLGAIDIMENIQDPSEFNSWKVVNINKEISYDNFVGIFFNTENQKFSDKSVRQGLSYAIAKEGFDGDRALGPISPNSWGYNPQVKQYIKDVEKSKDVKGINIVLSTLPNLLKVAEKIKNDWEQVGVTCEIQVVKDVPVNYEAFLATVDIPKDPDQYNLWHSTQTETNISKIKNPRIDKLLEDGRTELDQETRKKSYLDFQRFLIEDVPAIFLYHPTSYSISRK